MSRPLDSDKVAGFGDDCHWRRQEKIGRQSMFFIFLIRQPRSAVQDERTAL
jgi:hypothetical protein